jgi:hypothetical protein
LTAAQRDQIPDFLWHDPEAYGFRGSVWTTTRVARVLTEEFGVTYSKTHSARLLVIWDGSPIHRRQIVTEFVTSAAGQGIQIEALPGYAPDLNPWDAGGWHQIKYAELGNQACRDLDELHLELHLAIGRLRQKPDVVRAFFTAAGLVL